jgi:hypothetical protein
MANVNWYGTEANHQIFIVDNPGSELMTVNLTAVREVAPGAVIVWPRKFPLLPEEQAVTTHSRWIAGFSGGAGLPFGFARAMSPLRACPPR